MTSPEIINLVHDLLSSVPELAEIQEWNKANSLVTLASTGGSIGIEKEEFEAYTRDEDEATAYLSIVLWIKNADPVEGEAQVRALAQAARKVLIKYRTLNGAVDDSFVHKINYATADGGKSIMLHLAELDYRVSYMAERSESDNEDLPAPDTIEQDLGRV
ncbi:MAG TPA: hypothetical protein VN426_06150 [Syntrophomonadaceae bacterium]|nr:hypothetical protein [Syntrophomonadaceae bacterium]